MWSKVDLWSDAAVFAALVGAWLLFTALTWVASDVKEARREARDEPEDFDRWLGV